MNKDIDSIALIGFDITQGPVLKWKKSYSKESKINIDELYTNFYIMFKGGGRFKPKSIIFDEFQLVAFADQMDLLCVFLNRTISQENYKALKEIAETENNQQGNVKSTPLESESDQFKSHLIELLTNEKRLTIQQLKKHFPVSYWTIRRYLTDLEADGKVVRNNEGKTHIWSVK